MIRREEERQALSRQEDFLCQTSLAERAVMGDLVGFLRAQGGGRLNGVNWALFLAGDIADSFFHEVVVDGIDLRLVVDASPGSEMQRSFIREMESTVDDYLAQKGLDYTQKTGDNWHRGRRSFDPDDHEYERYMDHFGRHNDIRFVIDPDPAKYQRKIDIVINAIGSRGIEEQEKWEWASRKRQPVILADTRFSTFHL